MENTVSEKTVLIVEDDVFILETMAHKFVSEGFKLQTAKDVDELEKYLSESLPNVILLDILLPKLNGLEILKKLKADPKTKNIPVVIFSNLGSESDIKQAMDLGASDYLVKASLTPNEVVNKINNILAK